MGSELGFFAFILALTKCCTGAHNVSIQLQISELEWWFQFTTGTEGERDLIAVTDAPHLPDPRDHIDWSAGTLFDANADFCREMQLFFVFAVMPVGLRWRAN